jgi:hypothetical protein
MMKQRYFHFPLCALHFGADVGNRLNCIISFGCVDLGKKQWQRFNSTEKELRRSVLPSLHTCRCPIDLAKDEHLQVVAGAERLHITIRNIQRVLDKHAMLSRFIKEFETRYGTDARVRIRADWVFEVRDGKGMSYQELAVLAAIYSKIGASRRPVRILRDDIWQRAHGFKSDWVFRQEMNGRTPFVTCRQVRSIIDRLDARKFFARVTYARRQTYYSHRMSAKELNEAVFQLKTRRDLARRASRMANAELTRRIQAERRRLATLKQVGVIGAAT